MTTATTRNFLHPTFLRTAGGLALLCLICIALVGCGTTTRGHRVNEGRLPETDAFGQTTQSERERLRERQRILSSASLGSVVQFNNQSGGATVRLREDPELIRDARFLVVKDLENGTKGILGIADATDRATAFISAFLLEGRAAIGDTVRLATEQESESLLERHQASFENQSR